MPACRIFDISDPTAPKEVAWFVPPRDGEIKKYTSWWRGTTENVFIEWDRNLIWIGTHEGTYCLSLRRWANPCSSRQSAEVVDTLLQCGLGRTDSRHLLLRKRTKPDGLGRLAKPGYADRAP